MLNNLISNSIKFTKRGQIKVTIASEATKAENSSTTTILVRFSIEDTGIGISEEQQAKLFQPFTQADNSTTREYGGTGLGLAICRRIVELMEGTIGVNSDVGRGSTFWFTVPLEIPTRDRASQESEATILASELSSVDSIQTISVLVVEDYPDNRDLTLFMLDNLGYTSDSADNGQEALDKLDRQQYDVILMDCQMPKLNGYQTTQIIRQRKGQERHTTIIGLTANAMSGDRQKCLDAGMDDYLSKPIDFDELNRTIKKWC